MSPSSPFQLAEEDQALPLSLLTEGCLPMPQSPTLSTVRRKANNACTNMGDAVTLEMYMFYTYLFSVVFP